MYGILHKTRANYANAIQESCKVIAENCCEGLNIRCIKRGKIIHGRGLTSDV